MSIIETTIQNVLILIEQILYNMIAQSNTAWQLTLYAFALLGFFNVAQSAIGLLVRGIIYPLTYLVAFIKFTKQEGFSFLGTAYLLVKTKATRLLRSGDSP